MTTPTATRIVLARRPHGLPTPEDFRLETAPIPTAPAGGLLLRVEYMSLDPYMRGRMDDRKSYAPSVAIGDVMPAESVCEVIASDHADFRDGEYVAARTGWCTHAASDGKALRRLDPALAPLTTRLGVLGMPGFTGWSGLMVLGKPKRGETVAVAAATGPVGSLVGQLARMAGARAVGIAGGADKCRSLTEDLQFDAAVDHRAGDLPARLQAVCPDGIDVYFENVGGAVWQAVLPLLNTFARVPVCGLISQYQTKPGGHEAAAGDALMETMRAILTKSLMLRGFINYEFADAHYDEFLRVVSAGIASGEIRYREDITDGLAAAPETFIGMLQGRNFGKVIIRVG